jgi:hypothetical protein
MDVLDEGQLNFVRDRRQSGLTSVQDRQSNITEVHEYQTKRTIWIDVECDVIWHTGTVRSVHSSDQVV